MNYVASAQANGSISYVEYSFALERRTIPVVKVLNAAGYYTLPTQYNVAVSLEAAQINMDPNSPDYLLQNLTNVYTDPDPRTYPLSSYVYMIEPTGIYPSPETEDHHGEAPVDRRLRVLLDLPGTEGDRSDRVLTAPVNLVEAGFGQINKLQQADPGVDLTPRTS